jgi:hypothetical protein
MARCDDARPFLGPDTGPDAPGARDALILHHSCVSSTNGAYPPPFTLFLYDWCLSPTINTFPLLMALILHHSRFSSTIGAYPPPFMIFLYHLFYSCFSYTIGAYSPSFTIFLYDWCLSSIIHAFPLLMALILVHSRFSLRLKLTLRHSLFFSTIGAYPPPSMLFLYRIDAYPPPFMLFLFN